MLQGCITGNGGHFTAMSIRRFKLFESAFDVDELSIGLIQLWRERHGHPLTQSRRGKPRPPRASIPEDQKYCGTCDQPLPKTEFCRDASRKDGLSGRCRACAADKWFEHNRQICSSCGSYCVGHLCRRCTTIQKRVDEIERGIATSVSYPIWKTRRDFELFAKEIGKTKLSRAQKLHALMQWKPGK